MSDSIGCAGPTPAFVFPTNEKIRALKAEDLVDERFAKKLEQEGRF